MGGTDRLAAGTGVLKRALPYLILAAGAAFLLTGIWRGETAVVLSRAAHICLECIGIG